jgi:hypothetical protein
MSTACKVPAATTAFANTTTVSAAIAAAVAIAVATAVATAIAIAVLPLPLSPHCHLCAIFTVVIANIRNCCYIILVYFACLGYCDDYDVNCKNV